MLPPGWHGRSPGPRGGASTVWSWGNPLKFLEDREPDRSWWPQPVEPTFHHTCYEVLLSSLCALGSIQNLPPPCENLSSRASGHHLVLLTWLWSLHLPCMGPKLTSPITSTNLSWQWPLPPHRRGICPRRGSPLVLSGCCYISSILPMLKLPVSFMGPVVLAVLLWTRQEFEKYSSWDVQLAG